MQMSTRFCITLLLRLNSVVPRRALWCVSLLHSVLPIHLAEISATFSIPHVLLCRLLLLWWAGVGRLVKFVGTAAVDATAPMEKRGLHPALGALKEVEGITLDRLREIVGYMDVTKSTLPGLKKLIKDVKKRPRCGPGTYLILRRLPMGLSTTPEVCFGQTGVCIRIIDRLGRNFGQLVCR